jgi:hypothetical protein
MIEKNKENKELIEKRDRKGKKVRIKDARRLTKTLKMMTENHKDRKAKSSD